MAKSEKVRLTVEVDGLAPALKAFSAYGKEAQGELRDAAQREVNKIAPILVSAMRADSKQSAMVAQTIKAKRDRVPVIKAAGATRVGGRKGARRPSAGDVFFGAEFGGQGRRTTQQFRPHRGTEGYAFYPTLRRHIPDLIDGYIRELERLAHEWATHGGA